MSKPDSGVFGIAWYRPEQWSLMLSLIPDPEVFPNTHEEWLAKAMKMERELTGMGIRAVRVEVELKALLDWAAKEKRPADKGARSAYALLLTQAGLYR